MATEKFGVENITMLLVWGAGMTNKIVEALADKKISSAEGFQIAFEAIALPFKSFEFVEQEIKDLSDEEVLTINKAFQAKFDIKKEEAEKWVEDSVFLVLLLLKRFLYKETVVKTK